MGAEGLLANPLQSASAAAEDYALGIKLSFSGRAWRFQSVDDEAARALELKGIGAPLARLLAVRGITPETLESYLAPKLKTLLPDPFVLANMEKAAKRFAQAVIRGEGIAVLADYDVDGACAAASILGFLKSIGRDALLHVPDRLTEGYGPQPAAMKTFAAKGAKLAITVDCGAAAEAAMLAARGAGLDTIVLDHHAVEKNPPVFAHVNPNGPDDTSGLTYICGTGVVFFFLVAAQRALREAGWFAKEGKPEADLLQSLDLVALATIADVVPLKGVNRAFIRQGLKLIEAKSRLGFAALAEVAKAEPPYSSYHLGFVFGPRINAGGRVGRCDLGARLMSSADAGEARGLAAELDMHNRERQAIEAQILEQATEMAARQADQNFILLAGDGWHPGVVGIVAGRLKERFAKPTLVAGFEHAGAGTARGSARSVLGVDLGRIVRDAVEAKLLHAGGGHAMAAGFTLARGGEKAFADFLREKLAPSKGLIAAAHDLVADALVSASGASLGLLADLERAGPFGAGNPEPVFVLPDQLLAYADVVGSNHVRFRLVGRDNAALGGIAFRIADTPLGQALLKARGKRIHAAGRLKRDEYGGSARVQLHLEDAALAGN